MAVVRRIIPPSMLLALLWLVLAQNQLSSWLIGIPFIALALLVIPPTGREAAPLRLHGRSLVRFLRLFITDSLRGGIDVSRRVLAVKPAVNPGFFDQACLADASIFADRFQYGKLPRR